MKQLNLFCLLFLSATLLYAQPYSMNFGYDQKSQLDKGQWKILAVDTQTFYVVSSKYEISKFTSTVFLEKYTNVNQPVFVKEITTPNEYNFQGVYMLNGTLQQFATKLNKTTKTNELFARKIEPDGSTNPFKQLASFVTEKSLNSGAYSIYPSANGKRVAISYEFAYQKGVNEKIYVAVFDDQLDKLWDTELTLSVLWAKDADNTLSIDDSGKLFLLKKLEEGKIISYAVYGLDKGIVSEQRIKVEGEKSKILEPKIIREQNKMIVAAYYSYSGSATVNGGTIEGIVLYKFNEKGEIEWSTQQPFTESQKQLKMVGFLREDDKTVIISELYSTDQRAKPTVAGATPEYDQYYYTKNVFVHVFSGEGNFQFDKTISKALESINDNGATISLFYAIENHKIHFLYNDHESNYGAKKNTIRFVTAKYPVYLNIDLASGVMSEAKVDLTTANVGGRRVEMLINPSSFIKLAPHTYLMKASNTTLYKMGTVRF